MQDHEVRGGIPVEVRADEAGIRVSGYAAVFNEIADIGGYFRERILPGAFREAISRDDVVFLINHDGLPLARTRSGTLTLSEDDHGLKMETILASDDPDVASITTKMKRGDLDKMSFAFSMRGGVQTWDETSDPPLRTIEKVGVLHDVSIVTTPAYDGTEIGLRSLADHREATRKSENFAAARKRLQMKHDLAARKAR